MKPLALIAAAAGALMLGTASSHAAATSAPPSHPFGVLGHIPGSHVSGLASIGAARHTAGLNCVSSCTSYEATVNQYLTDVAAGSVASALDNVYSVLPEYSTNSLSVAYSSTFAGSIVDTNNYPARKCRDGSNKYCVTDNQLQAEIGKVVKANGWPTQSTTTMYLIFTPQNVGVCHVAGDSNDTRRFVPCTSNVFCAYHGSSNSFIYAVEPDDAAVPNGGCDAGQSPAGNGADPTLSTISHEEIEAITDPLGNGWWSADPEQNGRYNGSEIGDLCAWNFGADLGTTPGGQSFNQVINGHDYYIQQEWSNAANAGAGGCVQSEGGTPFSFQPGDPLYAGTGPLVYHSGPVMTSTAIYAIYWVPAAATNTHPPKIAGAAEVGRKIHALPGAWTNSPSYAYQWLRCSGSGSSCAAIHKATDAGYEVTPADAGHKLEVRVTAITAGGRASATSIPTVKVRS